MGQILKNATIFRKTTVPGWTDDIYIAPKRDHLADAAGLLSLGREVLEGPVGGLIASGVHAIDKAARDTPEIEAAKFFGTEQTTQKQLPPIIDDKIMDRAGRVGKPTLSESSRQLPSRGELAIPLPDEATLQDAIAAGEFAALQQATESPDIHKPTTSPVPAPLLEPTTSPVPAPETTIQTGDLASGLVSNQDIPGKVLSTNLPRTIKIKSMSDLFALAPYANTPAKQMMLYDALKSVSDTGPSSIMDLVTGKHKAHDTKRLASLFPKAQTPIERAKVQNLQARTLIAIDDAEKRGDLTEAQAEALRAKTRQGEKLTRAKVDALKAKTKYLGRKKSGGGVYLRRHITYLDRETRNRQKKAQKQAAEIDKALRKIEGRQAEFSTAQINTASRLLKSADQWHDVQADQNKIDKIKKALNRLKEEQAKGPLTSDEVGAIFKDIPEVTSKAKGKASKEAIKAIQKAQGLLSSKVKIIKKQNDSISKSLDKIMNKQSRAQKLKELLTDKIDDIEQNTKKADFLKAKVAKLIQRPSPKLLKEIFDGLENFDIGDFAALTIDGQPLKDFLNPSILLTIGKGKVTYEDD